MIKPLADYVLITQQEAETQTASGIYIPETAAEKPKIGTILAIGKKVKEVAVGDHVVYKPYGVTEVRDDDKTYLIIKEEDILGIRKGK